MSTCAYRRCQAGGVILEGAPMVERQLVGDFVRRDGSTSDRYPVAYHPGCWAAEQLERERS